MRISISLGQLSGRTEKGLRVLVQLAEELHDLFFVNNLKSLLIQASPRTSQAAVKLMLPALLPGPPP